MKIKNEKNPRSRASEGNFTVLLEAAKRVAFQNNILKA